VRTSSPPPSGPDRRLISWLLMSAVLFSAGCQTVGGPAPSRPAPSPSAPIPPAPEAEEPEAEEPELRQGVVYQGIIEIGGGNLPAALEIIQEGRRDVRGALQTASGLLAEGEGRLRGNRLELELVYGGDCPGQMSLDGEWDQESQTYRGTMQASDCTGKGEGTFLFTGS
jgi:hypothetical protein